jgi:hypothetical protein
MKVKDLNSIRYYKNSNLHRENGPAIEFNNGSRWFWLNGFCYSFEDYLKELKKRGKRDKDIMLLALKYG